MAATVRPSLDDPTDLPAGKKAELERNEQLRLAALQEVLDLKWLMSDKRGRRFIWGLLSETGLYRNPFVPGSDSQTAFNCGEMNGGQRLLARLLRDTPQQYSLMTTENQVK